jgi:two-component system sensor histidine kinase RegB
MNSSRPGKRLFPHRSSDRAAYAAGSLSALNMKRLLLLRAGAVIGWVLALMFAGWQLEVSLPFIAMSALIAGWCIVSLVSWVRLRDREDIEDRIFVFQLLLDVAMLGLLLYLSGGSTNPLTLLLLLPLIVSAALLPGVYSWIIAAAIIACYTLLLYRYVPLPVPEHEHGVHDFELHVTGMWLGFVLSAGLIVAFVARMGSTLRERDRLLSESKQRALRDERIVALGALAAGAAHELGTPLGTISLIAEELSLDHEDDQHLQERLGLLREQVSRCKHTLAMLSLSAGQSQAASGHRLPVDEYLRDVLERWRNLRPATRVQADLAGDLPAPVIVAEQTLSQAIISILNNAADADRVQGALGLGAPDSGGLRLWNRPGAGGAVGRGQARFLHQAAGRRPWPWPLSRLLSGGPAGRGDAVVQSRGRGRMHLAHAAAEAAAGAGREGRSRGRRKWKRVCCWSMMTPFSGRCLPRR